MGIIHARSGMAVMGKKIDLVEKETTLWPDILFTRIGVMIYLTPQFSALDEGARKQLSEVFEHCLQEHEKRIVIDLTKVKLLNSLSLGSIVDGAEKIIRDGGWLKLANMSPVIRDILDMTGVSDYVTQMNPPEKESISVFMPRAILKNVASVMSWYRKN